MFGVIIKVITLYWHHLARTRAGILDRSEGEIARHSIEAYYRLVVICRPIMLSLTIKRKVRFYEMVCDRKTPKYK